MTDTNSDVVSDLLVDHFSRVRSLVEGLTHGLTLEVATWRADDEANSIAWLLWHLTRIQDDHVAGMQQPGGLLRLVRVEQLYVVQARDQGDDHGGHEHHDDREPPGRERPRSHTGSRISTGRGSRSRSAFRNSRTSGTSPSASRRSIRTVGTA